MLDSAVMMARSLLKTAFPKTSSRKSPPAVAGDGLDLDSAPWWGAGSSSALGPAATLGLPGKQATCFPATPPAPRPFHGCCDLVSSDSAQAKSVGGGVSLFSHG
ncbi:unnamed protein product [Rangifer tarandus platyrhynchus]|uniref:Uncharacterized protein n=2 Tax=Rangifer tarandus platyrhynchus TaxID=3082113 RepID=A0AC59YRZ6_RANTA|nr:unnamed protein product [Rangifer tarandus platyrhynchus]